MALFSGFDEFDAQFMKAQDGTFLFFVAAHITSHLFRVKRSQHRTVNYDGLLIYRFDSY